MSDVDLLMLGPIEVVEEAGRPVRVVGKRQRALLALLALRSPRTVSSEEIIESLWSDDGIADPNAALHMTVSRLRASIGKNRVITEPGGYRLDDSIVDTDVGRFRALVRRGRQLATLGHSTRACESYRHGLALWRGAALGDLRDFDFAERAAARLEEERVAAIEHLMSATLDAGDHGQVVGELISLVDKFPHRERLWGLLMLALYRSGRQEDALGVFKRLSSRLASDLGVDPGPEVADLERRILLQDPALSTNVRAPAELGDETEFLTFSPGDVIFEQGEEAGSIYWIEEGRVEVLKTGDQGRLRKLAELGRGRYFGELAAALGIRRTATVRAIAPTTVSVHDLASFRTRLSDNPKETSVPADAVAELWSLVRRGQCLQVFDTAAGYIDGGVTDPEYAYLAVLALARAGARSEARKRYAQYGLGSIDSTTVAPRLAGDIAVLPARLDKDEALVRRGTSSCGAWAERAAAGYATAYERSGSPYHAVNAATMWLLAGNEETARELALRALSEAKPQRDDYWDAVTAAEAHLIVGNVDEAKAAVELAAESGLGKPTQRAATLRQLKLVCDLKGMECGVFAPIRNPTVVHFCGHRVRAEGERGRFSPAEEPRVRAELGEVLETIGAGIGFGSLAAGADILAAEALLDRGAELHVILPFGKDEFVATSVSPAGGRWVERFERCLASAATVEVASPGEYLDDPVLFDFCSRVAMGDTLLRARHLETEAHQVVVWDGTPSDAIAGTAVDHRTWVATGSPFTVIPVKKGTAPPTNDSGPHRRHIRAILFADFADFSKLTDAALVTFEQAVMSKMAHTIEPYGPQLLTGNTWGDAIHLVFADVPSAAECALDLVAAVQEMDMDSLGLSQLRGLRIGAHAAPVFDGWDPISGGHVFYGYGITKAARIEPRTPEGEIYVTHAFAALTMLSRADSFDCQYVGTLQTAKRFGAMPLYALRRRGAR